MKKSFIVSMAAALILGSLVNSQGQGDPLTQQQIEQIKSEITAASEPLGSGWAERNPDKALQCYSTEVVVCYDTLLLNYQQYAKGWKDWAQITSSVIITPIRNDYIVLTKDYAIATWVGNVEYIQKSGQKAIYKPIRYTDVWKKTDSGWKIIFEQATGTPVVQAGENKL